MSGLIELRGLTVRGRHGVYDFERAQGQEFRVDVTLELDLERAAASDDVADTVHYGELADRLAAVIAGEPVHLIETLADRLASHLLKSFPIQKVTIELRKFALQDAKYVSVTVTRTACLG